MNNDADYATFRKAAKAWDNRERKRRKLAPASATVVAAPVASTLHPKPRGPVPKDDDDKPCKWDGGEGRWLTSNGNVHLVTRDAKRTAERQVSREGCLRIKLEALRCARDRALVRESLRSPCWLRARRKPKAGASMWDQQWNPAAFVSDEQLLEDWWRPYHGWLTWTEGRDVECSGRGWSLPDEEDFLCTILEREGVSRMCFDSHLSDEQAALRQNEVELVWEREEAQKRANCFQMKCNQRDLSKLQQQYEAGSELSHVQHREMARLQRTVDRHRHINGCSHCDLGCGLREPWARAARSRIETKIRWAGDFVSLDEPGDEVRSGELRVVGCPCTSEYTCQACEWVRYMRSRR